MRQQSPGTEIEARVAELRRQIDDVQMALSATGEAEDAVQTWSGTVGSAGGGGPRVR